MDLPEVKGSHRKFRTVVASLIGEKITGNLTVFLLISSRLENVSFCFDQIFHYITYFLLNVMFIGIVSIFVY